MTHVWDNVYCQTFYDNNSTNITASEIWNNNIEGKKIYEELQLKNIKKKEKGYEILSF